MAEKKGRREQRRWLVADRKWNSAKSARGEDRAAEVERGVGPKLQAGDELGCREKEEESSQVKVQRGQQRRDGEQGLRRRCRWRRWRGYSRLLPGARMARKRGSLVIGNGGEGEQRALGCWWQR
ncbi:hypothetical protein AMTR_s00026p00141930 [Amborella trichopoda]|uniref:Uncharacterized protein n=1 Tax=Amborella trichopoda TaxID=13333 RepID=W1PK75_AMBTC|nr:hypothetical protein AMTR_s00026p00141930 [Amborella trichopoda]